MTRTVTNGQVPSSLVTKAVEEAVNKSVGTGGTLFVYVFGSMVFVSDSVPKDPSYHIVFVASPTLCRFSQCPAKLAEWLNERGVSSL